MTYVFQPLCSLAAAPLPNITYTNVNSFSTSKCPQLAGPHILPLPGKPNTRTLIVQPCPWPSQAMLPSNPAKQASRGAPPPLQTLKAASRGAPSPLQTLKQASCHGVKQLPPSAAAAPPAASLAAGPSTPLAQLLQPSCCCCFCAALPLMPPFLLRH